jgi:two-component system chemotaxis response regulator CheB
MNAVLSSGRSISLEPVTRVLVVDDSAVAREVLTTILRKYGFEVTTATSAEVAATRIRHSRPDVVMLDLQLPGQSGLEFLEQQMQRDPLPIVVCSGIAQTGTSAAIKALELGALDVLPKPALGVRALLGSEDIPLESVIRAAAVARVGRITAQLPVANAPRAARPATQASWSGRVAVIGASTGGTEALRLILAAMPEDAPPMVIAQHMPGAFTGAFAQRLNALSRIEVREATDGEYLQPGLALIAPGGRHLELLRSGSTLRCRVYDGPLVSRHRPSIDVLFDSAARAIGDRAVGVLLTGMGADGANGMVTLRRRGAHTIAQDKASCVVYGMPREAVTRGGVTESLPLGQIAAAILHQNNSLREPNQ